MNIGHFFFTVSFIERFWLQFYNVVVGDPNRLFSYPTVYDNNTVKKRSCDIATTLGSYVLDSECMYSNRQGKQPILLP